jgi:predicted PurR-regulated permease PerM
VSRRCGQSLSWCSRPRAGSRTSTLIFYAIYAQIENGYLIPRIMKTRVDLAGLAVLIALLVGTALAGVVGAIVSVPTAALVAVLMDEYVVHHEGKQAGKSTVKSAA